LAIVVLAAGRVSGQDTFWVAEGVGNWMIPTNWSGGIPYSALNTQINNGGTARLFDPSATSNLVVLGYNPGNSETLEVLGGSANFGGYIDVGEKGTGILKVLNGGTLFSSTALPYATDIGFHPGSNGQATVSGKGSYWQTYGGMNVGRFGTGALSILDSADVYAPSASIAAATGSEGAVEVLGGGSFWNLTGGDLIVAGNGAGELTIQGGAEVWNSNGNIGQEADGNGTVNVTGAGSWWKNGSVVAVGVRGTGMMTIADGGLVSSTNGRIGREAGSTGMVVVDGPGSE
jgi:T5SS/PEP-CTERM-associated repeat protein